MRAVLGNGGVSAVARTCVEKWILQQMWGRLVHNLESE